MLREADANVKGSLHCVEVAAVQRLGVHGAQEHIKERHAQAES